MQKSPPTFILSSMTNPVLHANTKRSVDHFLAQPSHALMIIGPRGSGKTYVAKYIASQLLNSDKPVEEQPYVKILSPQPSSISIEQIRELQSFLSLKVPGNRSVRRICIFEQAETLTTEAQNALLKILEEPPADTLLLLLVETPQSVLATIQSRVQKLEVLPLTKSQLAELAQANGSFTEPDIARAAMLSNGRASLFLALLQDSEHPLNTEIARAKQFLTASQFDRLVLIQDYKEKPEIALFLEALLITANAALKTTIAHNKSQDYKRWNERCHTIFDMQQKLELNVSTRLLLTSLALEV